MTRLRDMKRSREKEKQGSGLSFDFIGAARKHKVKLLAALAVLLIAAVVYAQFHIKGVSEGDSKAVVQYYYSHGCDACERAWPELEAAVAEFGDRVELQKKCVTLVNENSNECVLEQGLERYEMNMAEIRLLRASGTPTYLFGEKMVEGGINREQAKGEICGALYGLWGIIDLTGSKIEQCR